MVQKIQLRRSSLIKRGCRFSNRNTYHQISVSHHPWPDTIFFPDRGTCKDPSVKILKFADATTLVCFFYHRGVSLHASAGPAHVLMASLKSSTGCRDDWSSPPTPPRPSPQPSWRWTCGSWRYLPVSCSGLPPTANMSFDLKRRSLAVTSPPSPTVMRAEVRRVQLRLSLTPLSVLTHPAGWDTEPWYQKPPEMETVSSTERWRDVINTNQHTAKTPGWWAIHDFIHIAIFYILSSSERLSYIVSFLLYLCNSIDLF